jgi:SET domain
MDGKVQSPHRCDGCGRPPRLCEITNAVIPLKKCSRCCQSFYHDADCQRKHRKEHKKICEVFSKENGLVKRLINDTDASNREKLDLFQVQRRTDAELGLFAMREIDAARRVPFRALAPPILFANFRRTHCALCFQEVRDPDDAILGCDNPRYPVLLCSDECGNACEDWMRDEIEIIQMALDLDPNMVVYPMAIQVYRLLRFADWEEVMRMQSHPIVEDKAILDTVYRLGFGSKAMVDTFLQENPENGTELLQRQCVLMTVFRMLSFNKDALKCWMHRNGKQYTLNEDFISDFLQRIKYNAFTIAMEFNFPGFAMFGKPSYRMNHSCEANARQNFVLRKGQFPQLVLDFVKPVSAGEEICISYVDCDEVSIVDRRKDLAKKYRFHCKCPLCLAEEV